MEENNIKSESIEMEFEYPWYPDYPDIRNFEKRVKLLLGQDYEVYACRDAGFIDITITPQHIENVIIESSPSKLGEFLVKNVFRKHYKLKSPYTDEDIERALAEILYSIFMSDFYLEKLKENNH